MKKTIIRENCLKWEIEQLADLRESLTKKKG